MGRPRVLVSALSATLFAASAAGAQTASPGAPAAPRTAPDAAPAPAPLGGLPEAAPPIGPVDATTAEGTTLPLAELQNAPPPPTNVVYLQYGVAFTAEGVTAAGPICDNVTVPCILGTGGGVAVRAGWRSAGALYIGGAYELSKQNPNKLLRLAILQQVRAELRYYLISGRDTQPYAAGGLGVAGYGNEWGVDTFGPAGFLGFGLETQLTRRTVVGVALAYRLLYFQRFTDSSGADRSAGAAQLLGLDLVLEQRDPVFTERTTR